ncbi:hypothetical protein SDC9_205332 [bioreactor metagenome]|uniref:Uncharacterized protein n=1 Tax=bioreactor metagenome TaxID=1076179 RepID=A0A645J1T1_9ZZZZ
MSDMDFDIAVFQLSGIGGLNHIGAFHFEALVQGHPCQSAHAAAPDTDEKYLFNWTIEFLF